MSGGVGAPPRTPPKSSVITPHGAFHYSRVPPQKAQARRFAAPYGALGHCAFGSPPAVGALPRVGCRCCLRLRWGCSLWLLVLLAGVRSRLRSSFLLFGLACVAGFFAFLLVVPPLVFCGGSGGLVVRGFAFLLLAPPLGCVFGRGLPRRWVFRLSVPFAGLLVGLVAFLSCPAFGAEVAPLRGRGLACANGPRGLRRGGSHATASGRRHAGAPLMGSAHAFFYRKTAALRLLAFRTPNATPLAACPFSLRGLNPAPKLRPSAACLP